MSFIHRLKLTEYKASESLRLRLQQKILSQTQHSRELNPFNLNATIAEGASAKPRQKGAACLIQQRNGVCVCVWCVWCVWECGVWGGCV